MSRVKARSICYLMRMCFRVPPRSLAPILGLSLSVACGSSDGNSTSTQATDGGGDAAARYAAFCADDAAATCDAIASCCNMTVDACRSAEETICLSAGPDFSGPGVEFNSASAQACIAGAPTVISNCAYAPTSSPEYQATLAACRNIIVGTLSLGSECTTGASCPPAQPGSVVFCKSDSSGVSRCTAAPLLREGDPCDSTTLYDCASGLYCDVGNTPLKCTALKASGDTCSHANECISQICTNSTCVEPSLDAYCQTLKSN